MAHTLTAIHRIVHKSMSLNQNQISIYTTFIKYVFLIRLIRNVDMTEMRENVLLQHPTIRPFL